MLAVEIQRRFAMEHPALLNAEEDDSEANTAAGQSGGKRKRVAGRVPVGQDFWSLFDKWFAEKIKAWGVDLTSVSWKE